MQIQISWLLQKPTDLDLHCLQRQGISGFCRTRVKCWHQFSSLVVLSSPSRGEQRSLSRSIQSGYIFRADSSITDKLWNTNSVIWCRRNIAAYKRTITPSLADHDMTCLNKQCLSFNMWISIKNPDQVIWLAENWKWAWQLHLFKITWQGLTMGKLKSSRLS